MVIIKKAFLQTKALFGVIISWLNKYLTHPLFFCVPILFSHLLKIIIKGNFPKKKRKALSLSGYIILLVDVGRKEDRNAEANLST